jgi:uncharacterized protein (TIGR03437 family)
MRGYPGLFSLLLAGILSADPPPYVIATAAGYIPGATPISLQQHLIQPVVVAYDPYGNLYYGTSRQIWRLNPDWTVALVAGSGGNDTSHLGDGGPATAANMGWVGGLAIDAQENVYISDLGAYEIRKVTPAGTITRFAGTGAAPLYSAQSNAATGTPALKVALSPGALALDGSNLYVSDSSTFSVLAFTLDGRNCKVVAGNHGNATAGDGGLASNASLYYPGTLALANQVLYINENSGARLRQVNLRTGVISTFAQLTQSYVNHNDGLAADSDGTVYLQSGKVITRISPNTTTPLTWAGGGSSSPGDPGPALEASLLTPKSLAVNPDTHEVALADFDGNIVQVVSATTGIIQTVAGLVHFAGDGGPAPLALFNGLEAVVSDAQGNLYVADVGNNRIRKIDTSGIVTTVAGTGAASFSGDNGPAISAALNLKHAPPFTNNLAIDSAGNLYIADYGNGRIRRVDTSGVITTVAGGGQASITRGIPATTAAIQPGPLAIDASGNIYFGNVVLAQPPGIPTVYKIDSLGRITAYAGGPGKDADVGGALSTPIGYAYCLAAGGAGNLYICDSSSNRVRKVGMDGVMSTVAGNGIAATGSIQTGPPTATAIGSPTALAIDSTGNLFFYSARQVTQLDRAQGMLAPIAGTNMIPAASSGDGGYASQATFVNITGMTFDPFGTLYISDGGIYLREALPVGPNGVPPIISSGGVVGAGLSNPPVHSVSPGAIASIFGANFSPSGTQRLVQPSDLVAGKLPSNLAGICVSFGGVPALVTAVFPNQINVQIPALAPGPVTVQVTANCGGTNPVASNRGAVQVDTASPEFYSSADLASGRSSIAAINVASGPITAGSIVEAYGTGWGETSPAIPPGSLPAGPAQLTVLPAILLGGLPVPAANILYAGVSPCCAGLYQVDFTVPAGTPAGNLSLIITVDGISSPASAYITVQ